MWTSTAMTMITKSFFKDKKTYVYNKNMCLRFVIFPENFNDWDYFISDNINSPLKSYSHI